MTDPDLTAHATSKPAALPRPESGWVRLVDRVLIRISGPGTDKFLQGQFSQNLDEVVDGYSPRAAASTPKGRAYCLTRMARVGEDILMVLQSDLAEATLNHLRKYLMLFRGTEASMVARGELFGLLGPDTAETVAGRSLAALAAPGQSLALDDGVIIRVEPTAEGLPRFEFWRTKDGDAGLEAGPERSLADWQATEIAAGIASLTEATQEAFVPQMLNWQHVGGVHFKKGCYTGQEVIARMHFLGQLKKSLFRFRLAGADTLPAAGTPVLSGDRSVGSVVNAVPYADGHCELLAVVRHDAASDNLSLEGGPDSALEPLSLPYGVPEREKAAQTDT